MFRGAGWNVIKVLWGSDWDDLLARDTDGLLVKRMGEVVDGEYQRYVVEDGAYLRKHFWGADPRLLEMVRHLSRRRAEGAARRRPRSAQGLQRLPRGGDAQGGPTVILARTIKGYGLGEAGEGKNITHQQKKMNEADLLHVPRSVRHSDSRRSHRRRAVLPAGRDQRRRSQYMRERRQALGGFVPRRVVARAADQARAWPTCSTSSSRAPRTARRRRRWCS